MKLTYHPAANLFPLMNGVAFESLCNDIRINGQADPILVRGSEIIDGRNRYCACMSLQIVPRLEEWNGDDEAAARFVMSKNLHRRNLTASQKACLALSLEEFFAIGARRRMKRGVRSLDAIGNSADAAARCLFVSGRYVILAKRLKRADPQLFKAVLEGREILSRAIRELKRSGSNLEGCKVCVTDIRSGIGRTVTFPGCSVDSIFLFLPFPKPQTVKEDRP